MQTLLRIQAISLIFPILLGQTGLSLHTLYCFCKDQASTSLFFLQATSTSEISQTQGDAPGCCNKEDSCHREANSCEMRCEKEGLPCNTHEVNYLKLHQLSVESSIEYPNFQSGLAAAVRLLPDWALDWDFHQALPMQSGHPAHAPPGRFLRILHQSFLC